MTPEDRAKAKEVAASLPPLTDEQVAKVAALLRPYIDRAERLEAAGLEGDATGHDD